ncbi:ER-Golgi trafficking TRAPP I complex 85 kDa subunit [Nakaseomyces glabratus]|nr:ER-Golgi trafficking TRAPP I complex 85 kDa subunit [Nakaseomyces glabratus]
MVFSYEHYMNLIYHLDDANETVPSDIAKRVVSNAMAPVITVTSTVLLDRHIEETYGIDSLYMLLRFFGGCVSDRDQANEVKLGTDGLKVTEEGVENEKDATNGLTVPRQTRVRSNSNSLYQRDATQSQYVRFTKPLADLINTQDANDMLFDYHSLEVYLQEYLSVVDKKFSPNIPHHLLKTSIYHSFFALAISSTSKLSPFECFNHPIVSLLAIDITRNEDYETAAEQLKEFKSMNNNIPSFPSFINTNDILPVFLLCYNKDNETEFEECQTLAGKLKKQLFVESIILPLWSTEFTDNLVVSLHQPVMSSIEEIMFFLQNPVDHKLPLKLVNCIYDQIDMIVYDLMKPFMKRKMTFWEETILTPRKSLFHGAKFFKKFMNKSTQALSQPNSLLKENHGSNYLSSTSPEFLMRKLADWSMMVSDFKTAYTTYESLCQDFERMPKYLASCSEWCAVSLLMGAQNIVTAKMLKNEINPAIERALGAYELCATESNAHRKSGDSDDLSAPVRSYETRCMFLASELFLSLSDTWTSTPFAIAYLETILNECKLGPLSEIMIWERLSDCYGMRIDPRIKHRIGNLELLQKKEENMDDPKNVDVFTTEDILSKGLTRNRKAALFKLIAARKWCEQKQWRELSWCLDDLESTYSDLKCFNKENLLYTRLRNELIAARQDM